MTRSIAAVESHFNNKEMCIVGDSKKVPNYQNVKNETIQFCLPSAFPECE